MLAVIYPILVSTVIYSKFQHFKHTYQGCTLQWSLDHRVLWTKLQWILSKSDGVWQFSLVTIDCEPIAALVGVGIPYVWKGDLKFVECNVFLFRGLSVVTILCSPWGVAIVLLQYSLLFWVYLYFVPTMWLLYHLLTTCQLQQPHCVVEAACMIPPSLDFSLSVVELTSQLCVEGSQLPLNPLMV